jgi:hypothetical protein
MGQSMNTGQMIGIIGGIAGSLIGIAGGLVGTYFSIKRTNGPKERQFMIKVSVVIWVAISIFLACMFLLPSQYRGYMWIPYGIMLGLGIPYINKTQQKIRKLEIEQANRIVPQPDH